MIYLLAQMLISGRESTEPLYQAEIPSAWHVMEREEDIADTTKPIASFKIGEVAVAIHNFPGVKIAPEAQIERWKRQIGEVPMQITQSTHSGFVGLILESEEMMGGAFQLAPYYQSKIQPSEKTSDWTIKAVGPIHTVRAELLKLIHSFELIDAL